MGVRETPCLEWGAGVHDLVVSELQDSGRRILQSRRGSIIRSWLLVCMGDDAVDGEKIGLTVPEGSEGYGEKNDQASDERVGLSAAFTPASMK